MSSRLFDDLEQAVDELEIAPKGGPGRVLPGRRRAGATPADAVAMRIVEHDGVFYVGEGTPPRSLAGPRRRRGPRAAGERGEDRELLLSRLEPSKVSQALRSLDVRCNGYLKPDDRRFGGLRKLTISGPPDGPLTAALAPIESKKVATEGKILLLVHGTFSKSESYLENFAALDQPDRDRLYRWMKSYDQVLAFDHPTLALSPALNARRLHEELGDLANAHVDVVCHSRGGLVTRWWLEGFDRAPADRRRAVFVGCPLHGTGLAAPANARGSLSLLLNVSDVVVGAPLKMAGSVLPLAAVVAQLYRIFSSVASIAVESPALDAAFALVPGVAAMSRTSNNLGLEEMRRVVDVRERYFFVQSNFEPADPGWKFWKRFRRAQLLNSAADVVFDGHNDMVVDTDSMTDLAPKGKRIAKAQILDYETNGEVHHTNYFSQARTTDQIAKWLA